MGGTHPLYPSPRPLRGWLPEKLEEDLWLLVRLC